MHPRCGELVVAGAAPEPVAILVNGPSSSGKSTLCRALHERLIDIGTDDATFASVAFDDVVLLISDTLFPISFVALAGGDITRLVSREPHDGRAAWEYVDESATAGGGDGHPRVRLVLRNDTRRLLSGVHRGWGEHLALGTNLIIDHFLQDKDWCDEALDVLENSGLTSSRLGSTARCRNSSVAKPHGQTANSRDGHSDWPGEAVSSVTRTDWTTT